VQPGIETANHENTGETPRKCLPLLGAMSISAEDLNPLDIDQVIARLDKFLLKSVY
jgi:hypothetical protein